ncbi:MAG: response regulator [Elusimicrobia bacterium]|nr:response regulator [Elusimicrobiota bacterium]
MAQKRVLVIDDDDDIRDLLALIVSREGFAAETAWDGQQGLEAIQKAPPDLVIMDLMLPRYGGFELLRKLQEDGLASLPVIVITGRYNDPATMDMIRKESNVADFMAKPVDTALLGKTLKKLLA